MEALEQFQVDEKSGVPIWIQIRKRLIFLITSGKYEQDERLPSVRELSVLLGVNYNTVNKVYQDLERDGFTYTKRGMGTYVADVKNVDMALAESEVDALAASLVQKAFEDGMTREEIVHIIEKHITHHQSL